MMEAAAQEKIIAVINEKFEGEIIEASVKHPQRSGLHQAQDVGQEGGIVR